MAETTDFEIRAWQEKIAAGDENAFNKLFRSLYPSLVHFSTDIVHTKSQAEEIVSDVLIKIWQQREMLLQVDKLRVYLFVAVKNHSYNYLRKYSPWTTELSENNIGTLVYGNNPEDDIMFRELQLLLHKTIESLPEQCRQVYKLIKDDGLKYKEVAEILNISPRTVETQLFRAVKKIRKILLPDDENDSPKYNTKGLGNKALTYLLLFS
jgi:RNA polymerase sigma-70 factor (family 1)